MERYSIGLLIVAVSWHIELKFVSILIQGSSKEGRNACYHKEKPTESNRPC